MPLTTRMRDLFAKYTTTEDSTGEKFGTVTAWIHVGSDTGAFDSAQNSMLTGVSGNVASSASRIKLMESGYPQRTNNALTYRALYSTEAANFDWNEWGLKNTSASSTGTGTLFNRKQEALGTKTNTQSWQITA